MAQREAGGLEGKIVLIRVGRGIGMLVTVGEWMELHHDDVAGQHPP